MKAVVCSQFGLPDTLQVLDIPTPVPSSKQVLIAVEACGVNFPDVLIIQNKYQFTPVLPFSPGGEVAGTIVELGDEVQGLELGQRVLALCGWGGFAEKVAVDADRVFPIPQSLSVEVAATTLVYLRHFLPCTERSCPTAGRGNSPGFRGCRRSGFGSSRIGYPDGGSGDCCRVYGRKTNPLPREGGGGNDQLRNGGPENANQRT